MNRKFSPRERGEKEKNNFLVRSVFFKERVGPLLLPYFVQRT